MSRLVCLLTGATGLLGRAVIDQLLADERVERIYGLARGSRPVLAGRLIPMAGDVRLSGLGLSTGLRASLAGEVNTVLHLAANTSFSQPLAEARANNLDGTQNLLELTSDWSGVRRWIYVSTAFVAGTRTGRIAEHEVVSPPGFVNAYEQSKFEAEQLVRGAAVPWTIARPATVVCDDASGTISQINAVHRALRLYSSGLAAMLPSTGASTVDSVTTDHVARAITRLALGHGVTGTTYHVCAGAGAITLDQMLDETYKQFAREPSWARKGISRPEQVDLATYRLFEQIIEDAGSLRVRRAVHALSHFVPQLAHPKIFDTTNTDALLGYSAPPVMSFWANMVATLVGNATAQEVA